MNTLNETWNWTSLIYQLLMFVIVLVISGLSGQTTFAGDLEYEIERSIATSGFDKKMCWVHARAGAIPPNVPGNPENHPAVVLTMQKLLLSGSDVFYALNEMRTDDMAKSWSGPQSSPDISTTNSKRWNRSGDI